MNLFEFNTDKMSWTKTPVTSNPGTCYVNIKVTDESYFKQLNHVFANMINKKYRLILIDHTTNKTIYLESLFINGWDVVNNKPKLSSLTKDSVTLSAYVLSRADTLTDLNNYWLYLQYE